MPTYLQNDNARRTTQLAKNPNITQNPAAVLDFLPFGEQNGSQRRPILQTQVRIVQAF
jgi:hypothetical protein